MIVKVVVIGSLGLHELGDIGQCAPSGGNLSLEKFELPSAPLDAGLALDPVVNAAGERNHFLLGRFHAERHPTPRHRARGGGDDLVCQGPNSRVEDELPMPFIERRVRGIWKKPLQV